MNVYEFRVHSRWWQALLVALTIDVITTSRVTSVIHTNTYDTGCRQDMHRSQAPHSLFYNNKTLSSTEQKATDAEGSHSRPCMNLLTVSCTTTRMISLAICVLAVLLPRTMPCLATLCASLMIVMARRVLVHRLCASLERAGMQLPQGSDTEGYTRVKGRT